MQFVDALLLGAPLLLQVYGYSFLGAWENVYALALAFGGPLSKIKGDDLLTLSDMIHDSTFGAAEW